MSTSDDRKEKLEKLKKVQKWCDDFGYKTSLINFGFLLRAIDESVEGDFMELRIRTHGGKLFILVPYLPYPNGDGAKRDIWWEQLLTRNDLVRFSIKNVNKKKFVCLEDRFIFTQDDEADEGRFFNQTSDIFEAFRNRKNDADMAISELGLLFSDETN